MHGIPIRYTETHTGDAPTCPRILGGNMNIRANKPAEGVEVARTITKHTETTDRISKQPQAEAPAPDRIDISDRSKKISELMARIEKLPEIRVDKVRQIREAIESGTYKIDPRKIVDKILREL